MMVQTLPSPTKSSAAGQYLGYSLQQVRLCFHLLTAGDSDLVSLELLDDIAIHRSDGTVLLEQAKSALTGNPASNKSGDLWKTLANWVDTCVEKQLNVDTTEFHYFVSTGKPGSILSDIIEATNQEKARVTLAKIRKFAEGADPGLEWVPHIQRFLGADEHICATIIHRCRFTSEDDPVSSVETCLHYLPPEKRADYPAAIIGLARDRIDAQIRKGRSRAVRAVDFRRDVFTFISRHNFSNVLRPSGTAPAHQIIEAFAATSPMFVRQLSAIEVSASMMMSAVSDYLRTNADKVEWAERGVVLEDSFVEFDTQLERQHAQSRDLIEDDHSELKAIQRGRRIYRRCIETQIPLEGQSLPAYFVSGAFNCLAHDCRIGWHPDYRTLFSVD